MQLCTKLGKQVGNKEIILFCQLPLYHSMMHKIRKIHVMNVKFALLDPELS